MKFRELGASKIKASVVGLGAWAIGGWLWGGTAENEAIKAIHAGLDAGINFIDTAPIYGFGISEEIVGKAIRDCRDKVVLATKCGMIWHKEQGEFFFSTDKKGLNDKGPYRVYKCNDPAMIRYEIELSLKRLNIEYIDLYQTHWQESTTPISETMQTLMDLKAEGKIRAIGCSNANPEQMKEYQKYGQLDSDQEKYSMLDRGLERKNLIHVDRHNIAFLAYSPLALGLLTGKIGPDRKYGEGDLRVNHPRFGAENLKIIQNMLSGFKPVADRHGVSLSQLVIAWTIAQKGCSHALVGARTVEQAVENAKAGDIGLSDEDIKVMDEVIANNPLSV